MLGHRVEELHDRIGINQREAAELLGYKPPTLAQWKTRQNDEISFRSALQVATTFQVSIDWLVGDTYPMWSPQLMAVRKGLIGHIIKDEALHSATQRERILAVWQYIQANLPTFQEHIFGLYLGWKSDDWQAFLDGRLDPHDPQFERAEWVTGIPARWFKTGAAHWIEPLRLEEYREAIDLLTRHGLSPEDVVRLAQQKKNPKD